MPDLPPPAPPTLARPLSANAGAWFGPDSYPAAAVRRGATGRAVARLAIDPSGRIAGCRIVASSGDADLDRATCSVPMQRGRFRPALAADGTPIAASYTMPVRWVLPDEAAPPDNRPSRTAPMADHRHGWIDRLLAAHHLAAALTTAVAFMAARLRRTPAGRHLSDRDAWPVTRRAYLLDRWWSRSIKAAFPILLLAALFAWIGF